jgi:hypothetical protein
MRVYVRDIFMSDAVKNMRMLVTMRARFGEPAYDGRGSYFIVECDEDMRSLREELECGAVHT